MEVRLLGGNMSCGCTMITEYPRRLKPFERRLVGDLIDPRARAKQVEARFITDVAGEQPVVH